MPNTQAIVVVLVAIVAIGIAAFESTRHAVPVLTAPELASTAEGVAAALVNTGTFPTVGTTWTGTDAYGNRITYLITASTTKNLTIQATGATGVVAIAGAHAR
jgi:ABC-type dipeptide/oligopeptide/nickel transport system permease subunit